MGWYSRNNNDETSRYKKEASIGNLTIGIRPDNSVELILDGKIYNGNVMRVLRDEVAPEVGLSVDPRWNTRQLGSKLVDIINGADGGSGRTSSSRCNEGRSHRKYVFKTIGHEEEERTSYQLCDSLEEAREVMADFINTRSDEHRVPPKIREGRHGIKELHFSDYDWWYEMWIEEE
ncbi:MAG: hypothetical protein J6T87_00400 [Bacteroidales bacterium]|nr:hypothetical protein [Bacteroidales bacterium]